MAGVAGRLLSPDRAFERLYKRHAEEVYRYALAVLGNRPDAEDVVQTTFLNAYRSYRAGSRPDRPLNWLITIAHNVCRQRFRTEARRPSEVALDPDLTPAGDGHEEPFRNEDIRRALSALTFAQRSALAMRELEGRSYREIAAALDLTESAVETLIFRARKAFREQLEGTLTCTGAERAISRQLDGMLDRRERGDLRAHLRECEECSSLAKRFRAQRSAFRGIVLLPLPHSLASFSAGGSSAAAVGAGIGLKAAAFGSAALLAVGVTSVELATQTKSHGKAKAPTPAAARTFVPQQQAVAATPVVYASSAASPATPAAPRVDSRRPDQPGLRAASVRHAPHVKSHPAPKPRPITSPGGAGQATTDHPAAASPGRAHASARPASESPGKGVQVAAARRSQHAAGQGKPAGSPPKHAHGTSAPAHASHPTPQGDPGGKDAKDPTNVPGQSSPKPESKPDHGPQAGDAVPAEADAPATAPAPEVTADRPNGPPGSQGHEQKP